MSYLKKIVFVFAILLLANTTLTAQNFFTTALATARAENKLVLLNFSGSDWCIPCIQMHKEYFQGEEFKKQQAEHIIFINADFPRKKKNKQSPEMLRQNEALADKYNPEGAFPFTILLDADGRVLKKWDGKPDEKPAAFFEKIKKIHLEIKS